MAYTETPALVYLDGVKMVCERVSISEVDWFEKKHTYNNARYDYTEISTKPLEPWQFRYEVEVYIDGQCKRFGANVIEKNLYTIPRVFRCWTDANHTAPTP